MLLSCFLSPLSLLLCSSDNPVWLSFLQQRNLFPKFVLFLAPFVPFVPFCSSPFVCSSLSHFAQMSFLLLCLLFLRLLMSCLPSSFFLLLDSFHILKLLCALNLFQKPFFIIGTLKSSSLILSTLFLFLGFSFQMWFCFPSFFSHYCPSFLFYFAFSSPIFFSLIFQISSFSITSSQLLSSSLHILHLFLFTYSYFFPVPKIFLFPLCDLPCAQLFASSSNFVLLCSPYLFSFHLHLHILSSPPLSHPPPSPDTQQ